MRSRNGDYYFRVEEDTSSCTIYYLDYSVWESTRGERAVRMLDDGDLVFVDRRNVRIWESNTTGRGDYAVIENDGTIVVYDLNRRPLWYTGSRLSKGLTSNLLIYFNFI